MNNIYEILKELGINYTEYTHPAVFTCEESDIHCQHIPGGKSKNLFLRNKKGDKHYLVTLPAAKRADLKNLARLLSEQALSFASPERLMKYLGVTPGSVTILGLINDANKEVAVIIDEDLWKNQTVQYHPLTNTATLVIEKNDLNRFLQWTRQTLLHLHI
ncbi:MAG: prolyl-tRNA synthetase associated domain-containing protein [Patescibacteria group bacterium]